jgi:hypothetical protein
MTAREYKEWEAYERAAGPLDSTYEREMLAEIHEIIQVNNLLTGASLTKKGKKNPAGKFRKVTRADELFLNPDLIEEVDDEDDDDFEEPESMGSHKKKAVDDGKYDPSKDPFAK